MLSGEICALPTHLWKGGITALVSCKLVRNSCRMCLHATYQYKYLPGFGQHLRCACTYFREIYKHQ